MVEGVIHIIRQRGEMDSEKMINIDTLTQLQKFMYAWMGRVVKCQSLITSMMMHVKRHVNEIEKEHCLTQRLQDEFLETTYQPPLAT